MCVNSTGYLPRFRFRLFLLLIVGAFTSCSLPPVNDPDNHIVHFIDPSAQLPLFDAENDKGGNPDPFAVRSDESPMLALALVDEQWRRSAVVTAKWPVAFDFTMNSSGHLQFWAAVKRVGGVQSDEEVTLVLDVTNGKDEQKLEYVLNDPARWKKFDIPLTIRAGDVRCRFRIAGENDPVALNGLYVLLGSPMFVPDNMSMRPHVFLIVIDSLRSRDTGIYGSNRADTPFLDEFSRHAVTYASAITTSSWTLPSVKNMLSGHYTNTFAPEGENLYQLDSGIPLLQEVFAGNGWFTGAITANHLINVDKGFDRGFALFDPGPSGKWTHGSSESLLCRTREFLLENKNEPMFLYLHIMDPHDPYTPVNPFEQICDPPPDSGVRESLKSRESGHLNYESPDESRNLKDIEKRYLHDYYRGEIRQVDSLLEQIVRCMRDINILESSIILVTADHGEEFGEHGYYQHGKTLYQESVRVPMVLRHPDNSFEIFLQKGRVSTIDIPISLMTLAGIKAPDNIQGVPIYPPNEALLHDRALFSVLQHKLLKRSARNCWRVIFQQSRKIIWTSQSGWSCYDLDSHPDEKICLSEPELGSLLNTDRFADWKDMAAELDQFMSNEKALPDEEDDPKLDQKLRQLGYIQ
ncbi:sulfatase [bacterium]|nr:sulfatase [candidate division CSSED10-310 bacterium]